MSKRDSHTKSSRRPGGPDCFATLHHRDDVRIIPLDGRPHLPPSIHTCNAAWSHLIEHFTRIAADEIRYALNAPR